MTHLWVRAEQRNNEDRVGLTPEGAARLVTAGFQVSVEDSTTRAIAIDGYRAAGCEIVAENSWPDAPDDAIIFGLKELPEDGTPLRHRHIMFGHAYKGQPDGRILLQRFKAGGGTLYDLEYLVDETGRRVAAFGYWAGFAGAAISLKTWAAQQTGTLLGPVSNYKDADAMIADVQGDLAKVGGDLPRALVIGALGRVGTGAREMCAAVNVQTTDWDMAETASGGPFPEIMEHEVLLNSILAAPGCPVFVPNSALNEQRRLTVIGDIACDPSSEFSPIKVYDRVTSWDQPALRVSETPVLDVMAIDNLPSLLPVESSEDFAEQLLPSLLGLDQIDQGVWARAYNTFKQHLALV